MTDTAKARLWRIVEGVAVIAAVGAFATAAGLYESARRHDLTDQVHSERLNGHDSQLEKFSDAGVLVRLAQATTQLEKLEDGAKVSFENRAAIAAIQSTVSAQTDQLRRIESRQESQTEMILRAIRRSSDRSPRPQPAGEDSALASDLPPGAETAPDTSAERGSP